MSAMWLGTADDELPPEPEEESAALANVETSPLNRARNWISISLKGRTSVFFIFAISSFFPIHRLLAVVCRQLTRCSSAQIRLYIKCRILETAFTIVK